MEKEITYRHNIMNINSLDTFLSIKGGFLKGRRDVYFVRALGCGPDTEAKILAIDERMGYKTQDEMPFYRRLKSLPPLTPQEDMEFYGGQFEAWKAGGKLSVRNRKKDELFGSVLGAACLETAERYRVLRKNMTGSIEKNFVVKLLYWTDQVLGGYLADWNERQCFKILAEDVQKEQEYLFYYMLTLIGCDVLLLECRKDISTIDELKALSAECRIGEFDQSYKLPEYRPCRTGGKSAGSDKERDALVHETETVEENRAPVRVVIPEKAGRRRAGHCTQSQMQSESQIPQFQMHKPGQSESQIPQFQMHKPGQSESQVPQSQMHKPGQSQSQMQSRMPQRTHPQEVRQAQVQSGALMSAGTSVSAEKSFEELALLASSIVMIAVYDRAGEPVATGSGIMIGRDGYILTNNHVTRGGCFFAVRIEDDDNIYKTQEIIKYNSVLDLAVIRIDRQLDPLPLYRGRKLARGQKVVAIGSPLGMFNSVSDGIISGFREIDSVDMIQFTAPISHGSSGGALLNMQGEVIGISTAGIDEGQNLNLAVSYEDIRLFVRGFTGMQ